MQGGRNAQVGVDLPGSSVFSGDRPDSVAVRHRVVRQRVHSRHAARVRSVSGFSEADRDESQERCLGETVGRAIGDDPESAGNFSAAERMKCLAPRPDFHKYPAVKAARWDVTLSSLPQLEERTACPIKLKSVTR